MEKSIKLTLKQAKDMYKIADPALKQMLELNFNKNQLVGDITEVINNFDDVLKYHHTNIVESQFEQMFHGITKKEMAFKKLQLIESCLNNGESFGDYVYWPYFNKSKPGLSFSSSDYILGDSSGVVASFVSRKVSDHVGKTFLSIYQDFILG